MRGIKVGFKEPVPRPTGPNGDMRQPYFLFDTPAAAKATEVIFTAPRFRPRTKTGCSNT